MGKWWNSLLHGSAKTKRYLWLLLLLIATGLICIILGILFLLWVLVLGGVCILFFLFFVLHYTQFQERFLNDGQRRIQKAGELETGTEGESLFYQLMKEEEQGLLYAGMESQTEFFKDYGEKRLKELLKKYRVKKSGRTIMVDCCPQLQIKQCPAYAWTDKGNLFLLLLEQEPRSVQIPLEAIDAVYYEPGAPVGKLSDYQEFAEESIVSKIFEAHLPTVHETVLRSGKRYYKNLYVIAPGIRVTNTSARNLLELLKVDFWAENEIEQTGGYGVFVEEAYPLHILRQDGVISAKEFQKQMEDVLRKAYQELGGSAYQELLLLLVREGLLTREYAKYYFDGESLIQQKNH